MAIGMVLSKKIPRNWRCAACYLGLVCGVGVCEIRSKITLAGGWCVCVCVCVPAWLVCGTSTRALDVFALIGVVGVINSRVYVCV